MKRIFAALLVAMLIIGIVPMSVGAAGSASATASSASVGRGDTFTITVSAEMAGATSLGVSVSYDATAFELTGGSWLKSGVMADVDAKGLAVIMFGAPTDVTGSILTYSFKVLDGASFGAKSISVSVKAGQATVGTPSTTVTVACNHNFTNVEKDEYIKTPATCTTKAIYYKSCSSCGEKGTDIFVAGELLDHTFDKEVVDAKYLVSKANCTTAATYYKSCVCGAKGTETFTTGEALGHDWKTAYSTDASNHWFDCTRCDEKKDNAAHNYNKEIIDDKYVSGTASCTEKATFFKSCECGAKGTETFTTGDVLGHNWKTEYSTNGTNHWFECTRCDEKKDNAAHNYNQTVATNEYAAMGATCTAKATYYKSCVCGAKGTETFESGELAAHRYTNNLINSALKSPATCTNKAVYYKSCEVCMANHASETFEGGNALGHKGGTATCTEKAVCETCGEAYGNVLPHTYDQNIEKDEYKKNDASCTAKKTYYKTCKCGDVSKTLTFTVGSTLPHDYTAKSTESKYIASGATCSTKAKYYVSCSICGGKSSETFESGSALGHNYSTSWSNNASIHYHSCSRCGVKSDEAVHVPGAAATEKTAQTCTVCGYIIVPALGHTHKYSSDWSSDSTSHWYACSGCEVKKDEGAHVFDNACDTVCNTCGYEREITHAFKTEYASDAEGHWYECSVCGEKNEKVAHIAGPAATEEAAQTCTECGYEIAPVLEHVHDFADEWKNDGENHWHECRCGEKSELAAHTWNEGEVTLAPTYDAEGVKTFKCTACEYSKTESVAKLQKKEEVVSSDSNVKINVETGSNAIIDENTELKVDKVTEETSEEVKAKIEEATAKKAAILAAYDISLVLDGAEVQPGGKVAVTLPAPENAGDFETLQVVYVDDEGNVTPCDTKVNEDGTVTFTTDHFSYYAIVGVPAQSSNAWIIILIAVVLVLAAGVVVAYIFLEKKKKA